MIVCMVSENIKNHKDGSMEREIEFRKFLDDVAQAADGDFATGLKMLGFVVLVSEYGAEDLLSGSTISPRTYISQMCSPRT